MSPERSLILLSMCQDGALFILHLTFTPLCAVLLAFSVCGINMGPKLQGGIHYAHQWCGSFSPRFVDVWSLSDTTYAGRQPQAKITPFWSFILFPVGGCDCKRGVVQSRIVFFNKCWTWAPSAVLMKSSTCQRRLSSVESFIWTEVM